jgi:hypothetical protein
MIANSLILEARDLIVTTRDFCGNEIEAIQDLAADEGIPKQWLELYDAAIPLANNKWRGFQKAAGVKSKYWRY